MQIKAKLLLKSGEFFFGKMPANQVWPALGEVIFNTGMTGYVEALTDPSYAGQILVFTYPLIGNYGVADPAHWESNKVHVKGAVFAELAPHYSNHCAKQSLENWLTSQHIPFITEVDTRAVTKSLREKGVIPGAIMPSDESLATFENFEQVHWVSQVSIKSPEYYGSGDKTIIAVDCGMKENILRCLLQFPIRIKRVPFDYDYSQEKFDGVFLSNGPGDPTQCDVTIAILKKAMQQAKPIFGICLGTQLMALAAGGKTYKLMFGHRSQNQPCLHLQSRRSYLTSQNHGYAVDEKSLPADWQVSFRNLNDQSVAGIEHRNLPFFSVQFHPEAAPGPEDTQWLFQKFYDLVCS